MHFDHVACVRIALCTSIAHTITISSGFYGHRLSPVPREMFRPARFFKVKFMLLISNSRTEVGMFLKRCAILASTTSALMVSVTLFSTAQAGITLEQIRAEGRVIRPEVTSLKKVEVPEPPNLSDFVKDKEAAIALGKALFWDMQMGSNGVQACASCHYGAGADSRAKNQLSPGLRNANQDGSPNPDNTFAPDKGANFHLSAADFPVHVKLDPVRFDSQVLRDSNDIVSSQGVHYSKFVDSSTGSPVDESIALPDPDGYLVAGVNTRRAAPRNTPTVINAVFNHRQFWDGRAQSVFNGVNSLGDRDPFAFVYQKNDAGAMEPTQIRLENASLASQALEPPLSAIEQSADGRSWIEVGDGVLKRRGEMPREKGRRARGLRPLAQQLVHPKDSVLGELSAYPRPGLKVRSYARMIRRAFQPEWWASRQLVRVNEDGSRTVMDPPDGDRPGERNGAPSDENIYSQMEMNFSLFFGLAVQLYEATLVADDTPVDRYLEGDETALTESELIGFFIADGEGRCINCHGGPELTFASVSRINEQGLTRVRKGDLIDEGYNNIGVRPTLEDLGVGGKDALGNPLGHARMTHLGLTENPNIDDEEELVADLGDDGAFKIPGLRNVELTAPYFHNGGEATLEDVIDFYFRGGNFRTFNLDTDHPIIGFDADRVNESQITGLGILRGDLLNSGPGLDDEDKSNLVAFLNALTDERVRLREAPFDHPQLFIPDGHPGDHMSVTDDGIGNATDELLEIPAVGAKGGDPLPTFADNLAEF